MNDKKRSEDELVFAMFSFDYSADEENTGSEQNTHNPEKQCAIVVLKIFEQLTMVVFAVYND